MANGDFNPQSTSDILRQLGAYQGERIERLSIVAKDTLMWNGSEALEDETLFGSVDKRKQYRNIQFPNNNHAYAFTHMRVNHNVLFTVDNAFQMQDQIQYFHENSKFEIKLENESLEPIWLWQVVERSQVPLAPVADTAGYVGNRDHFNNWYQLPIPIPIALGTHFELKFVPAEGLTTKAWELNKTPILYNSSSFTNDSNEGHAMYIYLQGWKFLPKRP